MGWVTAAVAPPEAGSFAGVGFACSPAPSPLGAGSSPEPQLARMVQARHAMEIFVIANFIFLVGMSTQFPRISTYMIPLIENQPEINEKRVLGLDFPISHPNLFPQGG